MCIKVDNISNNKNWLNEMLSISNKISNNTTCHLIQGGRKIISD